MPAEEYKGHIAALFTVFLRGTTFISTKVLLTDFLPVEILFIRFCIGWFILFLFSSHGTKQKMIFQQELVFASAGFTGTYLYFLLKNIALTYTMDSNVGVLVCISPFLTALLVYFGMKSEEKLQRDFFIGFIVAISGIFLISFNGSKLQLNPLGDILALSVAFVWACHSICTKKISKFGLPVIFATKDLEINFQQKIIMSLLFLLIILLLVPSLLPKSWAIIAILRKMGAHGITFFLPGILVFLRFDNNPMINLKKCSSMVQWDCIFLTAAMLPFTTALNAESTGINEFLIQKFSVIFSGLSPLVFIFLVIAITMVATQFMNNAICGAIMFSIVYPFAVAINVNPAMITVLMIFCLALAMLTPAGSPMSALMFGNTNWITAKEIYKYVVPGMIVIFLCVCVVGIPIGFMVF